jgi:hypothetical protein
VVHKWGCVWSVSIEWRYLLGRDTSITDGRLAEMVMTWRGTSVWQEAVILDIIMFAYIILTNTDIAVAGDDRPTGG